MILMALRINGTEVNIASKIFLTWSIYKNVINKATNVGTFLYERGGFDRPESRRSTIVYRYATV